MEGGGRTKKEGEGGGGREAEEEENLDSVIAVYCKHTRTRRQVVGWNTDHTHTLTCVDGVLHNRLAQLQYPPIIHAHIPQLQVYQLADFLRRYELHHLFEIFFSL